MRKFSFTSSQANGAFVASFPIYKHDASWIAVAKYLYGSSWRDKFGISLGEVLDGEENESSEGEGEDGSDEEQENTNDKYDPPSIQDYLSNLNPEEDEDMEVAIE